MTSLASIHPSLQNGFPLAETDKCDDDALNELAFITGSQVPRTTYSIEKWTGWDLNPRPLPCQDSDLPADLPARGASMREPSLKPCPSRAPPSDVESRAASCTGARSRSTATPPRAGRTKSGRAIPGTLLRGQGHHGRVTGEDREVTVPLRRLAPGGPEVLHEFPKAP